MDTFTFILLLCGHMYNKCGMVQHFIPFDLKQLKLFVFVVSVHVCGGQKCLSLLLLAFETKSLIDSGAHWPSSLVKLVSSKDMPI